MDQEISLWLNFTTVNELLTVLQVKSLDESLVFGTIGYRVALITEPLVHIGPGAIFTYPNLGENATKLTPRVSLRAPEFDFYIILLRCNRLQTPFLELLFGEETELLLFEVAGSGLWCVNP